MNESVACLFFFFEFLAFFSTNWIVVGHNIHRVTECSQSYYEYNHENSEIRYNCYDHTNKFGRLSEDPPKIQELYPHKETSNCIQWSLKFWFKSKIFKL